MDNNEDKYIKDIFKKDDLISKNADDIFNKFIKGEFEVEENNKGQEQEVEITQTKDKVVDINEAKEKRKNNKKFKKAFSAVASVAVVFLAANVYASTQGYENIFFMIRDLINGDDVVIENKDEILSDRDITISYQPIEVSDELKLQINNLTIVENQAKLTVTVAEEENIKTRPASYEVYDITSEEKSLLANQKSVNRTDSMIASAPGSTYTEELELKNFKNNTKVLELDIYSDDDELLISFKINLEEKEIDVLSRKEVVFEKISEVELKEILSSYVALNYYNDTDTFGYINATMDEAKNSVLVELAMHLIYNKAFETNGNYTISDTGDINIVNEAIREITGKTFTGPLDIIDEHFIYFNEDTNSYDYEAGDAYTVPGLCLDISDISYKNGIYTVTCVYCFPGEGHYMEGTIGLLEQYKTTFELKINEDPVFAKYKIENYDDLISEKIKDADKIEPDYDDEYIPTNTVNKPTTNTISNTVANTINTSNTVSTNTVSNTTTVIKPSDKITDSRLITFLESVVRVNFFNDLNSVTEHYTKEQYENEMKLVSALEYVGGNSMNYKQQQMAFEEIFDLSHIDVYGSNIVVKNTGSGYEYISKENHYAFATILKYEEMGEVNGIHEVKVVYAYSDKNATINSDIDKYTVNVKYKVNDEFAYSKYRAVNMNEIVTSSRDYTRTNSDTVDDITDNNNNGNTENSEGEVIDNLASSLEWRIVYSIGMETIMPSTWEMIEFDTMYDGSDVEPHGEVSTCILGEAKGINKDTNEVISSHVQISYFTPMFLEQTNINDARKYIEDLLGVKFTGASSHVMSTDMSWDFFEKPGREDQIYCHFNQSQDGTYTALVISFDSDNWDNLKVINIMNRILGRTKGCSF